ncbi:retrovirus-related pol polyprotein from transposon TNT 1-94 [Tanacetum coccineum]
MTGIEIKTLSLLKRAIEIMKHVNSAYIVIATSWQNFRITKECQHIEPENIDMSFDLKKLVDIMQSLMRNHLRLQLDTVKPKGSLEILENESNKNVDTTPRYKNDNQTGQFGNQRAVNVAGARDTVGGQVVQQSGIQCFNCKEFGHFAKECRKPKRVKDSTYHKEKMLLCKQAEKGVQLQAEQSDWLADTDEEIDEQELEAHYSYMAKIQEVHNADSGTDSEPLEQVQYDTGYNVFANEIQHSEQSESISNTCVVETVDSNVIPDSPDMCDNDIQNDQNAVECDDERVALANLIANLKLDVDENKKIQKQLKKANASLTQELTECKSILAKTSRTLGESNSIRDSCLVALQNKQTEFERYKAFNDRTVDYDKLEQKHDELVKQSLLTKSHYKGLVKEKTKVITDLKLKEEKDIDKMISMENQLKFLNEIIYKRSQSIQTIHMLAPKCPTFNGRPTFANLMYIKKAQYEKPCLYEIPHDQSDPANRLVLDREETLTLEKERKSVETKFDKPSVVRQPNAQRISKPSILGKPAPFSDSLERKNFSTKKSVPKTNESEGLSKTVTTQKLPQTATQDVRNTNVIKPGMYRIDTRKTQTRAPQLPQTSRNTNPRVSTSIGVIHRTNVSRPQLRSTQMKDKVVPNNTHVKNKKTEVEDNDRISNKTKSVTASNDSLKSKTLNVNAVCATCGKCVFNSNHDACVSKYLNDVNARTKKPKIVQLILFIVNSGCTKHMTDNLTLLCNFVEKYLGTVHFGNDQFSLILGYEDLVQRNITINRVYYVEGLNHNLFSVGQFCDADNFSVGSDTNLPRSEFIMTLLHEINEIAFVVKLLYLSWSLSCYRLVSSCCVIFDLEPLSLSFDFVFTSEIFKSFSFSLDRLCHLAILCLDQHAHTSHLFESLLTIFVDRLDILKEDLVYQSLQKSLSLILKLS